MAVPFIQPSFAAGELAPAFFARTDLAKFHVGLSTCRNAFINYKGGAYSRAGTSFCGFSKQTGRSVPPRLITFQFSISQGLALEFGNFYMRVVSNGGFVLEATTAISGITQANPAVVTDPAHGYSNGDWVYLSGIVGMKQFNGITAIVAAVTTDTYELTDVYGNVISSASFSPYISGGTAARIYTLVTPYAEADLTYLKFTQSADEMSLTCVNQMTGTEYPPYDLARDADDSWTLTQFSAAPIIAPPASVSGNATVTAAGTAGDEATAYAYVITSVDRTTSQESIASPILNITNSTDIATHSGSEVVNWAGVTTAGYYNVYKAQPAYTPYPGNTGNASPVPLGAQFGFAGQTAGTQFIDTNIIADYTQVPPVHFNPFARGTILYADITNPGSGLTTVTYASSSLGGGTGATGYPVVVGGQLTAFVFTDGGQGFSPGDTIAFNGAGFAGGAIDFTVSGNPSNGDTITLNGVVWTFVTSITGGNQTAIQGTLAATLTALAANLSASGNANLVVANYTNSTTALNISYNTAGTVGDAYTLAASAAQPSGIPASGTLSFASNPTNAQTIILNGVTWTFVSSGATGDQTNIKANRQLTMAQLVADLNASATAGIAVASYGAVAPLLFITYGNASAAGDSYTLNGGTSGATPSGATLTGAYEGLTGGSGTTGTNPAATLIIGPETGTYPGLVAYFQQRRVYAATLNNPDTYYMSQPGNFLNFDFRIPEIDTDAITGTPWSVEVNGLQWMIMMPGGLVVLTGQAAWQLGGVGSSSLNPQPITPANQQAQPQAYNGCSATNPPIKIDYDIIYNQAKGSIFRDLSYNFFVNIYTGTDITFLSSQLFTGYTMLPAAWCEEPYKIIWVPRSDGALLSCTFLKQQDVLGWARHDTQGFFVSACSVVEPPVDALYVATQRFFGGPAGCYMIERMDNRIWQAAEDAWCVDCALTLPMDAPAATLQFASSTGLGSLLGVLYLVGGSGYSAGTTAQIVDPTGEGAVLDLTIVNGVVTAANFSSGGTGYSSPQINFIDPAGTGSGASGNAILNNATFVAATSGVFSPGMVGWIIRGGGGIATVTTYIDSEHLGVNITTPITAVVPNTGGQPPPFPSGDWTISEPVTVIGGLGYLGESVVTGTADGIAIPPQNVSTTGTITLPFPATAVTVGLGYTVQIQSLPLDAGQPTIQGRRKKIGDVTARLSASRGGFLMGTNQPDGSAQSPPRIEVPWTNLAVAPDLGVAPYGTDAIPLYTGDLRLPVGGGFAKPGQVALQQSLPYPLNLDALIIEVLPGDLPEAERSQRQERPQQQRMRA